MGRLSFVQEDIADGVERIEDEIVQYANADKDMIRLATGWEEHEQYEFKQESPSFRQRVRRIRTIYQPTDIATTVDSYSQMDNYNLTTKSKQVNVKTNKESETTIVTSVDMFRQFKYASNRGMLKLRCTYPVIGYDNLKWEVDFFYNKESIRNKIYNEFYPVVKIDLEIPQGTILNEVPKLPAGFINPIMSSKHGGSQADEEKVRQYYQDYFIYNPQIH